MEAAWMFCIDAFVWSSGPRVPAGEPAIPHAKTGITVQEQQASLPWRLQDKSSSFQLTLSTRQAEEGIVLECAREKNKIKGDFGRKLLGVHRHVTCQ